jgi:thioredoxin-related protein
LYVLGKTIPKNATDIIFSAVEHQVDLTLYNTVYSNVVKKGDVNDNEVWKKQISQVFKVRSTPKISSCYGRMIGLL